MSDVLKQRGTYDLITRTVRGHKRPAAVTEASVFIFTGGCIYALDDDGFCLEILPLQQTLPEGVMRCLGGQYVACLMESGAEAGLLPQPTPGGRALFVGRGTGQKMALLRTGAITSVEYRDTASETPVPAPHSSWGAADVELPWDAERAGKTYQQLPAVALPKPS